MNAQTYGFEQPTQTIIAPKNSKQPLDEATSLATRRKKLEKQIDKMFEGVMRRSLAKKSCMIEKDPSRRQTMHGIPQFEKLFSSPKRKTISTQHLDHEVFNNNTKAMSFPRSTIASSAPRLEIEKRLSVIDNQVHQMKGHHRRNSSYGGHQT